MFTKLLLTLIILPLLISLASAEMYKWVDDNGVVTFKDTPPPASKKRRKVKVYNDSDFAPAPLAQPQPEPRTATRTVLPPSPPPAAPPKKASFSGTVELYVTDWCGYCKKAQGYLKGRGIPFVAYDIEKDAAAHQRYKEMGGRGVPLIVVGSNRMSGFSQESLEYYLDNSR